MDLAAAIEATDLDRREKDVLLRRTRHETLKEVGQAHFLTRERVRQIELGAKLKLARDGSRTKLLGEIHQATWAKPTALAARLKYQNARRALREYFKTHTSNDFSYLEVYGKLGIELGVTPEEARALYSFDAMAQIYAEYRINRIGTAAHCTVCKAFKLEGEFAPGLREATRGYVNTTRGYVNTLVCRKCNTDRHAEYSRSHRERINAKNRERYARDPKKSAAYTKKWSLRKKLGLTRAHRPYLLTAGREAGELESQTAAEPMA